MLQAVVREKMIEALKSGDKQRKGVLSLLVSALANKEKENKMPLTKEQEDEVVVKMVKQIKETLASCPENRIDMIDKCKFELNIVTEFMPEQMSENDLYRVIDEVIVELGITEVTVKQKGLIMKNLMPKVKGKIDGQIVNKTLESYFSK